MFEDVHFESKGTHVYRRAKNHRVELVVGSALEGVYQLSGLGDVETNLGHSEGEDNKDFTKGSRREEIQMIQLYTFAVIYNPMKS